MLMLVWVMVDVRLQGRQARQICTTPLCDFCHHHNILDYIYDIPNHKIQNNGGVF